MLKSELGVPRYLTFNEVAREAGIRQRDLRDLIRTGRGPVATKVGINNARALYRDDIVAEWVRARRRERLATPPSLPAVPVS